MFFCVTRITRWKEWASKHHCRLDTGRLHAAQTAGTAFTQEVSFKVFHPAEATRCSDHGPLFHATFDLGRYRDVARVSETVNFTNLGDSLAPNCPKGRILARFLQNFQDLWRISC